MFHFFLIPPKILCLESLTSHRCVRTQTTSPKIHWDRCSSITLELVVIRLSHLGAGTYIFSFASVEVCGLSELLSCVRLCAAIRGATLHSFPCPPLLQICTSLITLRTRRRNALCATWNYNWLQLHLCCRCRCLVLEELRRAGFRARGRLSKWSPSCQARGQG